MRNDFFGLMVIAVSFTLSQDNKELQQYKIKKDRIKQECLEENYFMGVVDYEKADACVNFKLK